MSFFAGEFMPMVIGYAPFNVDEASSLRIVSVIAALAGLIMLIQLPKCRRFMYVAFTIMVLLYVRQVASVVFYATSAPRLLQSISPFFIALSVLMYVLYAAVIVIAGRNLAKTLKS